MLAFLIFREILQLDIFERADFKYNNIFFKSQPKDNPNKASLVPSLSIFDFREILQFDKFEGGNFKYDNIVFKFQPKNT